MIKGAIWWSKILFSYIFGHIFLIPLSCIFPKKKNLVIFIGGGNNGNFNDNVKYLYLYVNSKDKYATEYYFLTERKEVYEELKKNNLPVIIYPSCRAIIKLLRTSILVVDNWLWFRKFKYYLLYRSTKIQLWHGAGMKKIEFGRLGNIEASRSLRMRVIDSGRFPVYDLVISTSAFYTEHVFLPCFKPKAVFESGYPRNDILFRDVDTSALIGTDIQARSEIISLKNKSYKIVLYAPTFRENFQSYTSESVLDLNKIFKFAKENNIIFVLKFHFFAKGFNKGLEITKERNENIIFYGPDKDIYPLLSLLDLIITDYSSIYIDFLLLDKPVIFFPYDLNKYLTEDIGIQFDYDWITPGPKCFNQNQLELEILKALCDNKDNYVEKRKEIAQLAFKFNDGNSSERIWEFINSAYVRK